MDPSLQEFYCISRSASQQRPLSLISASPPPNPSHVHHINRPQSSSLDYYSTNTELNRLVWNPISSPLSVPSIAQVALGTTHGQDDPSAPNDNALPGDAASSRGGRRQRYHIVDGSAELNGRQGSLISTASTDAAAGSHLSSQIDLSIDVDAIPWSADEAIEGNERFLSPTSPQLEYIDEEHSNAWPVNQPFVIQAQYAKDHSCRPYSVSSIYENEQGIMEEEHQEGGVGVGGGIDADEGEDDGYMSAQETGQQEQKPTPLPILPLFVLTVVIFSEPLTSTILFPFIYFMVRDFHITENEDEIGFFCGLIASSFFFAQFCTSLFWGYMSDKYGRRPILLLGLIGSTITCTLFGLSKSLVWAIASRSMCGLLNGNVGVAKSMLGEIADPSNQGQAFSLFGFAWGIGMIVGPILGSRLANPAQNFPEIFGSWQFFIEYPYFLPCFVASIGSSIGFLVGLFFLKETKTWPSQEHEKEELAKREALEKAAMLEQQRQQHSLHSLNNNYQHHGVDNEHVDQHELPNELPVSSIPNRNSNQSNSTKFNSDPNLRGLAIGPPLGRDHQDDVQELQERQPLIEPTNMPQTRFTSLGGQRTAAASGRQHYGSMSTLALGSQSEQNRGSNITNVEAAATLGATPASGLRGSNRGGRLGIAQAQTRPFQSVSAATGRIGRGQTGKVRPPLFQDSTELTPGSSAIQIDGHSRVWAPSTSQLSHIPTLFSSSYMPSMSNIYHRPSSYIPPDARSISVYSTGYPVPTAYYGDSSVTGYADWRNSSHQVLPRSTAPALIIPPSDRIAQQRLSATTSQIFVLPPDPHNKDPNQPVQLLVVPSNNTGLSTMSITTIIAYSTLALHSIIFEEVYTLYAVTPLLSHGLGWTVNHLGSSLAYMGLVQLTLQFVVYPRLERRYSAVFLFRFAQLLYVVVYLWFPLVRYFLVDEEDVEAGGQTRLVWCMVLCGLVLKYTCSVCSYTSIMVMITNSSPPHLLGTVNGIGQTSASFMRAVGPAVGGIFWAWSISNGLLFPFNYFFVFFLMGTVAILCFVHSLSIPKELSLRRIQ